MKLELPLALGLLAIGCWLFLWPREKPPQQAVQSKKTDMIVDPAVQPAAAQEEQFAPPSSDAEPLVTSGVNSTMAGQTSEFKTFTGAELVNQAAQRLANGPAVQAKNRLRVSMFGQHIVATGNCYFSGKSHGKSRFDFEIQSESRSIEIQQICDGRHYLMIASRDQDEPTYTYIDLERVASSSATPKIYEGSPTQWLGIGGVGGLLEQLANDFEFKPVEEVVLGGIPMLRIQGQWKTNRLRKLLDGTVADRWLEDPIHWEHLPPQLPREVVLYLGTDNFLPLFPYRIEFIPHETRNPTIKSTASGPMVRFEMYEVVKDAMLEEKLFELDLQGKSYVDLTSVYVGRLHELQSAEQNDLSSQK